MQLMQQLILGLCCLLTSSALFATDLKVKVLSVGQGNGVLVSSGDQHMIVDFGSTAFTNEWSIPLDELGSSSEENSDGSPKVDQSTQKNITKKRAIKGKNPESQKPPILKKRNKVMENIRKSLHRDGDFHVKTVVVTHGDKDHYSWLPELFDKNIYILEHLILGGLPSHYEDKDAKFITWVKNRLQKDNTKVYLPAVVHEAITTVEDFEKLKKSEAVAEHVHHQQTDAVQTGALFLDEALNFGKDLQISLLSVNPTHVKEEGRSPMRMSYSDDANADSLVMKLTHQAGSMILTGDATELTTNRIIRNYQNNPSFLEADILLASHHGASSQGTNSKEWMSYTKPKVVLVSNGLTYEHPTYTAYEAFKTSEKLLSFKSHYVLTGLSEEDKKQNIKKGKKEAEELPTLKRHKTYRGIYSTLSNGDLTLTFLDQKDIKLEIETSDSPILLSQGNSALTAKESDTEEKVTVREEKGIYTLTPLTVPSQQQEAKAEQNPETISTPLESKVQKRSGKPAQFLGGKKAKQKNSFVLEE
ncbi:MAG: ComEC/Rec2 family competence protein [Alphaproteobacteria bacterium]